MNVSLLKPLLAMMVASVYCDRYSSAVSCIVADAAAEECVSCAAFRHANQRKTAQTEPISDELDLTLKIQSFEA